MIAQQKPPELAGYRGQAVFKNERSYSTSVPPIEKLLPRLQQVKLTGDRKWSALCPAHPDKRPSLSIRETDDGTLLLKCWSGCGGADIVEAVGLRLHDLFPRKLENRKPLRPGERWIPRDVLEALSHEITVAVFVIGDVIARGSATEEELARLIVAAGRVTAASREVGNGH